MSLRQLDRLHLSEPLRKELEAAAEAGYPEEVCGLLLGTSEGGETEVLAVRSAGNLERTRAGDRYELDPADHLAAELEARDRGLEVVGVWHSHPDHPAEPSATDLASAWAGWSYVIVPVAADGAGELRSWRLLADRFVEEAVDHRDESERRDPPPLSSRPERPQGA